MQASAPDSSAVRVALWRALHLDVDAAPAVLRDDVGLKLIAPDANWRQRGDMHPAGTRLFRAGIIARARFIEDLVEEQAARGIGQYVILGAGLDTFAQRRPEIASKLTVFEIDQAGTQAWKKQRLKDLGYGIPAWLRFVPVDFEKGPTWLEQLVDAGFNARKPALVVSTGVTLYLTKEAVAASLREIAALATGSNLAMTFILPIELCDPAERAAIEGAQKGAKASGTPFMSSYAPDDMLAMARKAGFKEAHIVSGNDHAQRYFAGRSDGLRPTNSEQILVAST